MRAPLLLGLFCAIAFAGCADTEGDNEVKSGGEFYVGSWRNDYGESLDLYFGSYLADEVMDVSRVRMGAHDKSGWWFVDTVDCKGAEKVQLVIATLDNIPLDTKTVEGCAGIHSDVSVTARGTLVVETARAAP